MHCALSLVSKGGNCILKASDVYHTENVKPNMTSKKCFHEKDRAQIPKLSVEKGGSGQPFLFKRRRLCLQKKSLKVFLLHNKQNMFPLWWCLRSLEVLRTGFSAVRGMCGWESLYRMFFFFSRMPNVWPCNSAVISTHKCLKLKINPVLP